LASASPAAAQSARPGTLVLDGEQPGAEVFVNAESVGVMPMEALPLEPGSHTVRVVRPGYTEFNEVVEIRPRRETRIEVELYPVSMALMVLSEPLGAQIFVDGNFSGEAPMELELLEGEHSLRLKLLGYHDRIEAVTAVAGSSETLMLELDPLPEDERRALLEPPVTEWYEEPLLWILAGSGAVVLALGITIILVVTATSDTETDLFCAQSGCARFDL
jgi:hypothetical protein